MSAGRSGLPVGPEDGVTRRQFLVGGGVLACGLAAAGAVGWRSWTVRGYWYRLSSAYGEAGTPPPSYPVTYEYGELPSSHLAEPAQYAIAYPPGVGPPNARASLPGVPPERIPVCICLPGRGRSPRAIVEEGLRFGDFVADGIEKRGVTPFAVAALQASDTYWHGRAGGGGAGGDAVGGAGAEGDGTGGDDAMAMLFDDFIPLLQEDLGLDGPLAMMGWSMGGYGALRAAQLRPAEFHGVCAVSPALWRSYDDGVGDAFDSAEDYAANDVYADVERLRGLPVRLDCGKQDPFYAADRAFTESPTEPPQGGFEPGGHNDAYWSRVAPAEVDFIGTVLQRTAAT